MSRGTSNSKSSSCGSQQKTSSNSNDCKSNGTSGSNSNACGSSQGGGSKGGCGGTSGGSSSNGGGSCAGGTGQGQSGASGCGDNSDWSASKVGNGQATIHLGSRYDISLNEQDGQWTVKDNQCGTSTRVWGDPHVDIGNDGSSEFSFTKDATYRLADGTKISVGTVSAGGGATMSSSLTITNGRNAVQVTGLADSLDGANNLQVTQSQDGYRLDRATSDGAFTADEAGGSWRIGGQAVTQQLVNQMEAAAA